MIKMEKEEFNLSKKAVRDVGCSNPIPNYYWEEDIKQFIKLLKEGREICVLKSKIDKLAGEELINS